MTMIPEYGDEELLRGRDDRMREQDERSLDVGQVAHRIEERRQEERATAYLDGKTMRPTRQVNCASTVAPRSPSSKTPGYSQAAIGCTRCAPLQAPVERDLWRALRDLWPQRQSGRAPTMKVKGSLP